MDLESPCSNEKLFQKLSSLQRESRILSRLSPTKDSVHYANSPGDLEDILCDVGEDDVYTMVLVFRIRDDPVLDRMEFYLENPEENQIESTLQVEKEWFENRKIKRQALRNAKEFFYFADSDDKTDKVKFVVHTTCKDDMAEGGVYVQLFDPLTGLVDTNMKFVDKQENPTISDVTCETLTVKFEHPVNDKGLETSYDLIIGEANGSKILARKVSHFNFVCHSYRYPRYKLL